MIRLNIVPFPATNVPQIPSSYLFTLDQRDNVFNITDKLIEKECFPDNTHLFDLEFYHTVTQMIGISFYFITYQSYQFLKSKNLFFPSHSGYGYRTSTREA